MVIEYTAHEAQMEIHRARGYRFRTVCTGRRFGKTLCMAAELLDRGGGDPLTPAERALAECSLQDAGCGAAQTSGTVCTGRRFGKTLCMATELLDRGGGDPLTPAERALAECSPQDAGCGAAQTSGTVNVCLSQAIPES